MANEKRLIDANALTDKVDESKYNNPHPQGMIRVNHRNEHDHFLRMILDAPTVDAVEVVRCKDCKRCAVQHNHITLRYQHFCTHRKGFPEVSADDFCSYGERKDNV